MKNLLNKRTINIGIIYLIFMSATVILYFATRSFTYRWLAVNLPLACVPIVFAAFAQVAKQREKKLANIIAALIWFAFFPNSFYMITNFIHVSYLAFDSNFVVVSAWFGLVYMTLGIMLGILAGVFSLDIIVRPIFESKGRVIGVTTVVTVSLLSGYAIYIGRFLRFNSWDLLTNPINLARMLVESFSVFAVMFSLIFAVCTAFIYLVFCILKGSKGAKV